MQNLIVTCIIILSIGILYRHGAPRTFKYSVQRCLFGLFTWMNAETLAKKMNPERFKNDLSSCCGCSKCPPKKETVHTIHIIRKTDNDN